MNLELIYCKIALPPKKNPAAKFASQGDTHMRTDTQIKFLYYPLPLQNEYRLKGIAIKKIVITSSPKNKTISLFWNFFVLKNYFTLFSHVYLLVFRNDYENIGNTVFFSFIFKNLILIIKHSWNVHFHLLNSIIYIPRDLSKQFWCMLYGTKASVLILSFETQSPSKRVLSICNGSHIIKVLNKKSFILHLIH